jgi:hypothetical protein
MKYNIGTKSAYNRKCSVPWGGLSYSLSVQFVHAYVAGNVRFQAKFTLSVAKVHFDYSKYSLPDIT